MQIPAVARALGSGRRVFSLPLVSFLDSQKLCTYVALQVARFNSVIHLWNSDSSGISALWKLPIFGEALPYKLWVHMAIKGRGCYRRTYHATPTFGGMCLTKLKGPWGKFAGQELPPVIFMGLLLSYSHSGSSNTGHHLRWLFWSAVMSNIQDHLKGHGHHTRGPLTPRLSLQPSNLREHKSIRSAHHLLYGKKERERKRKRGPFRCPMASPCIPDQFEL